MAIEFIKTENIDSISVIKHSEVLTEEQGSLVYVKHSNFTIAKINENNEYYDIHRRMFLINDKFYDKAKIKIYSITDPTYAHEILLDGPIKDYTGVNTIIEQLLTHKFFNIRTLKNIIKKDNI